MDNKNNGNLNQAASSTADMIGTKSQETMNAIKREGERYVDEAKERFADFKDQAEDKGRELKEQWDVTCRNADRYARQNPWHVAGIAAAIGAVAALLLTSCRRKD